MAILSSIKGFTLYLLIQLYIFPAPTTSTRSTQHDDSEAFHIAIVGSGIAGAASAFHIHNMTRSDFDRPIKITIYESSSVIGGQIKSTFTPEIRSPLEKGAAHFFEDDWCLVDAARSVELETEALYAKKHTRIWNGSSLLDDDFCFRGIPWTIPPFWDPRPHARREVGNTISRILSIVKLEWKEGFVPLKLRREMLALRTKFALFGKHSTFDNIYDELRKLGLGDAISRSAKGLLDNLGVSKFLQENSLEPCLTNSFGMNLNQSSGLHAAVSLASTRSHPISIKSGNSNLVQRMIEESQAQLLLNSKVIQLETGRRRRFSLTVATETEAPKRVEYDAVIFTGGSLYEVRPQSLPKTEVFQSHITYFVPYRSLEPEEIGIRSDWIPTTILTTENATLMNKKINITSLATSGGSFHDSSGCSEDDECDQFDDLHRVDSRQQLPWAKSRKAARDNPDLGLSPPMWVDLQSWDRRRFVGVKNDSIAGKVELEPNLFNIDNNFLDTMEASCRLGRNVALKLRGQRLMSSTFKQGPGDGGLFDDVRGTIPE
ncbi:hypothetical protein F5Y11DRAFT_362235 [Daldinia sp. FL1419]|nr:hypothetical protein F5Y11DRAFT_362235 [Daldinia sp. FL1419]